MTSTTKRLQQQAHLAFMVGQSARRQNFDVIYNVIVRKSSDCGSSVGTGHRDWDKFVVRVQHEIDYWRTLPDADPTIEFATADCVECGGQGVVAKKTRIYGTRPCPMCKGRNSSADVMPALLLALNAYVASRSTSERAQDNEKIFGWAA